MPEGHGDQVAGGPALGRFGRVPNAERVADEADVATRGLLTEVRSGEDLELGDRGAGRRRRVTSPERDRAADV